MDQQPVPRTWGGPSLIIITVTISAEMFCAMEPRKPLKATVAAKDQDPRGHGHTVIATLCCLLLHSPNELGKSGNNAALALTRVNRAAIGP